MSRQFEPPATQPEPATITANATATVTQTRLDQLDPIDAARCPLCGQTNQCAMTAEPDAQAGNRAPCWCVQETFPAALLASVPAAAQGTACICQRCLQEHADNAA